MGIFFKILLKSQRIELKFYNTLLIYFSFFIYLRCFRRRLLLINIDIVIIIQPRFLETVY